MICPGIFCLNDRALACIVVLNIYATNVVKLAPIYKFTSHLGILVRRSLKGVPERPVLVYDCVHGLLDAWLGGWVFSLCKRNDRLDELVDVGIDVFALIWPLSILCQTEPGR